MLFVNKQKHDLKQINRIVLDNIVIEETLDGKGTKGAVIFEITSGKISRVTFLK